MQCRSAKEHAGGHKCGRAQGAFDKTACVAKTDAPVITMILGTTTSEILLYDNPVAGAPNEAEELHARLSKGLYQ